MKVIIKYILCKLPKSCCSLFLHAVLWYSGLSCFLGTLISVTEVSLDLSSSLMKLNEITWCHAYSVSLSRIHCHPNDQHLYDFSLEVTSAFY